MLTLHNLPSQSNKKKKRVGRGNASKGNYSGRGMKGQRSRSGGKGGLKLRGLKQSLLSVPKSRGFKSGRPRPQEINLMDLENSFEAGAEVTAAALVEKKLIDSRYKAVKVLGNGKISKSLNVKLQAASKTATEAITKAGGTFEKIGVDKKQARKEKEQEQKK